MLSTAHSHCAKVVLSVQQTIGTTSRAVVIKVIAYDENNRMTVRIQHSLLKLE